jgi:hypothetical protein
LGVVVVVVEVVVVDGGLDDPQALKRVAPKVRANAAVQI